MPKPLAQTKEGTLATARHPARMPTLSERSESKGLPPPVFHDPHHAISIYQGDCLDILAAIPAESVDLIFADPPYFLSNGGITCHAGSL